MSNRIVRARHLTLVPDAPTACDVSAASVGACGSLPGSAAPTMVRMIVEVGAGHVWRRLRVRSDLLLPEFHQVVSTALALPPTEEYAFSRPCSGMVETYRSCANLRPSQNGRVLPGTHVRVDALMQAPGDVLHYQLDGESTHTVELMSIDSDADDLRPRCVDGFDGVDTPRTSTVRAANARLTAMSTTRTTEAESAAASRSIARLLGNARSAPLPRLLDLLPRCELTIESSIDLPVAEAAMSKMSWFLKRIGERGIRLTDSGCLPGPVVDAIRDELDWGIGWHGAGSDEADHHQVRDLREAARDLGLTRVWRGTLVRTKTGSRVADDHIALWTHCAARLPLGRREYEQDAGTLFLVALAASASAEQRDAMLVETMYSLRWGTETLDAFEVQKAAHPTVAFLDLIGAHGPLYYLSAAGGDSPSWARRFARDALRA